VLLLKEPQRAEQYGLVVGTGRRFDGWREHSPLMPFVGVRGDVLVQPLDEIGGEVERGVELMRNRPRLECAVRREVREALVGGVVAVGEAESFGDLARTAAVAFPLSASSGAIESSPSRSTLANGSPSAAARPAITSGTRASSQAWRPRMLSSVDDSNWLHFFGANALSRPDRAD